MQIKYFTSKGSIYVHEVAGENDYWFKEDKDGEIGTYLAIILPQ